jgi:hypothetical protein
MTTIRSQLPMITHYADHCAGTTRKDIVRSLKAEGFNQLGRGIFSVALVHPAYPDLVIKVGQRKSDRPFCDSYTDGFPEYVAFLRESRARSKFALKVYHHREVSGHRGGTYVTVSERCYPGKGSKGQKSVTAAANLVKGHSWCAKGADGHAVNFIRRLKSNTPRLHRVDLHSGNVMLRRDGTPVITDPLA